MPLTITRSAVLASSGATFRYGTALHEIEAGEVVYISSVTGKWHLAHAATGIGVGVQLVGVALNHAHQDQPVAVCMFDPDFTPGATLVKGDAYWLATSPNDGAIITSAELTGSTFRLHLGVAKSTTVLVMQPFATNATG